MKRFFTIIGIIAVCFTVSAQIETGFGARAFALANNHTALSSGVCDLYWNPAALAFLVSREFQASIYGIKQTSSSSFFGKTTYDDLQRMRIGNAGFSFALPTSRGGMSIAASYSNPVVLDDVFSFTGNYTLYDSVVSVDRSYRTTGNLNYWTVGTGVQIAKDFGVGISASLVTGKGSADIYYRSSALYNDSIYPPVWDDFSAVDRYLGYDIRAGLLYKWEMLRAGMRVVFPQILRYKSYMEGIFDNRPLNTTEIYNMYSSFSGAVGISATFPFLTVSTELRGKLPYDYLFPVKKIPDNSQAGYYKYGGGIGAEMPVVVLPVVLRAGYSYDDLDLHPWVYDAVEQPENTIDIDWSDDSTIKRNLHHIACGICFTSANTSFDLSYGFYTWGLTVSKNLQKIYRLNRILASVAVRF